MTELFFPDNHFEDFSSFHKLTDDLERLKKQIIELYPSDLNPTTKFEIIGKVNLNSINLKAENLYIKIMDGLKKPVAENFPAITQILKESGIPVNEFLLSQNGKYIESIHVEGKSLVIYAQKFSSSAFFSGSLIEFRQMIEVIKKLSTISSHLEKLSHSYKKYESDEIESLPSRLNTIRSILNPDQFDQRILDAQDHILAALDKYELIKENLASVSCYHCDLHSHNILCNKNDVTAVIDLESFILMPKKIFEGFSFYKLARKSISKGLAQPSEIKSILEMSGYSAHDLLPYCQTEVLRRISIILRLHYLDNDKRWDSDIEKQLTGLRESTLIFS